MRGKFEIYTEPQTITRTRDNLIVDTGYVSLDVYDINGMRIFGSSMIPAKDMPGELGLVFTRYFGYADACREASE